MKTPPNCVDLENELLAKLESNWDFGRYIAQGLDASLFYSEKNRARIQILRGDEDPDIVSSIRAIYQTTFQRYLAGWLQQKIEETL